MLTAIVLTMTCAAPEPVLEYELQSADGANRRVQQLQLTATGELRAEQRTWPVGAWFSLARTDRPRPAYPPQPHLRLTNGDYLAGAMAHGDGDAFHWRPWVGDRLAEKPLRFPTSAVAMVWLKPLPVAEQPTWVNAPRQRDVLQLKNGDLLLGSINKIDPTEGWRLTIDKREQTVPQANVVALGLNTDLARQRLPRGVYYRVVFKNGSRLSGQSLVIAEQQMTLTTLFNESFTVPLQEVIAIDVEQGKAVPLADIKPKSYDYQSFDGETATWSKDRTLNGQPLQLRWPQGVATYERGLGLPAGSTLTYDLAGKYQRLQTTVGIDIAQGERGSAVLQVLLDGQPATLAKGGKLTVKSGVVAISVDVRGVKELKLVVARHEGGFVQAAINIVQPYLVP